MMIFAKLSTAITVPVGPVLDSSGAEYTSAVVGDFKICKNNGTPAALNASATLTHQATGHYELVLTTSDISAVGQATIELNKTTYVCPPLTLIVLPAVVYDSLIGGTDTLQVDVTQFGGSNLTATGGRPEVNMSHIAGSAVSTTAAQIGVNVVQVSGDSAAADNLEAAADGTGYNLGGGSIVATSVTGNVGGNVTGSVGSVASGGISSASFAAGAINAAAIATGAIDADALATDAVTEIWAGSTAPTAGAIADAVWDEVLSGHLTGGTTGNALNAAGSAGDPWSTALPGAYSAGSAGYIIGTNINATISSRMATFTLPTNFSSLAITAGGIVDADLETIKGQAVTASGGVTFPAATLASTTNITAGTITTTTNLTNLPTMPTDWITADGVSAAAVNEIADAILSRNVSNVEGSAPEHSLCTIILAGLEYSVSGATWTIKRTDGTTTHVTKTLTSDAAASPVIGIQ